MLDSVASGWKNAVDMPRVKNLRVYMLDNDTRIITGSGLKIVKTADGTYLPLLTETDTLERFSHVVVDMGAVRFICKGANLMRPGITKMGEFDTGDIVCIKDESNGKYLAVGRAVMSSRDAVDIQNGQILENLHYISDKVWESAKEIHA